MHIKRAFAVLLALGLANASFMADASAAQTGLTTLRDLVGDSSAFLQRGKVINVTGTVVSVPDHRFCATIGSQPRVMLNCAQVKAGLMTLWLIWVAPEDVHYHVGQRLAIRATVTGEANGSPVSQGFMTRTLALKGDPFAVNISIDQRSLQTDFYRRIGRFYIDATVRNVSGTDQTITVWSNFGWSWLSDVAGVEPSTEALQNFPTKIVLAPQHEYKGTIEVATGRHLQKPVTFRFGFVPNVSVPASGMIIPPTNVTWSNRVTLPATPSTSASGLTDTGAQSGRRGCVGCEAGPSG